MAATVTTLADAERVAFLSGFVRFMNEIMHQIMTTVVTGEPCYVAETTRQEDEDDMMMMQLDVRVVKAIELQIEKFRNSLEKETALRAQKAKYLLWLLESRYLGHAAWEFWNPVVQDLHAFLIAHADDLELVLQQHPDVLEYAKQWWGTCLLPMIRRMDQANAIICETALCRRTPEIVDTPTEQDLEAERALQDERRDQDLQEQRWLQELCDHEQLLLEEENARCTAHRRVQEARDLRDWEDWAVASEMMQGQPSHAPRMRVRCTVSSASSTGSSAGSSTDTRTSVLHVNLPPAGAALTVRLELQAEEGSARSSWPSPAKKQRTDLRTEGEVEADDSHLMQRGMTTYTSSSSSSTPPSPLHTLAALRPEIRQVVARRVEARLASLVEVLTSLRRDIRRQLEGLSPRMDAVTTATGEERVHHASGREPPPDPHHLSVYAAFEELVVSHALQSSHDALVDVSTEEVQMLCHPAATQVTVLPNLDIADAEGEQLDGMLGALHDAMQAELLEDVPERRHSVLRKVVLQLVHQCRARGAKLKVLLHLLASLIPQPTDLNADSDPAVNALADRLMTMVLGSVANLMAEPVTAYSATFLDFDWSTDQLAGLSSLAINVMSFLENGRCDVDDMPSTPSHVDDADVETTEQDHQCAAQHRRDGRSSEDRIEGQGANDETAEHQGKGKGDRVSKRRQGSEEGKHKGSKHQQGSGKGKHTEGSEKGMMKGEKGVVDGAGMVNDKGKGKRTKKVVKGSIKNFLKK